jgi:hypothetical protein
VQWFFILSLSFAWERHFTMTTALLDDLAQRISQQQSALQTLRHELQTRRQQLADLNQRKKGLVSQLREIDQEIATLAGGTKPSKGKTTRPQSGTHKAKGARTPSRQGVVSQRAPSASLVQKNGKQSLPNLLLAILREMRRPMTVRELTKEARRRGFRTKSKNFAKNVESRCYDLQKRGLVRHPTGEPGFILVSGARSATHAKQAGAVGSRNGSTSSKSVHRSPAYQVGNQLPLNQVLTNILAKSRQPVPAKELAQRVLASGYRTKSKNFMEVIWVSLGKLKNIENVPGIGWRLKQN